MATQLEELNPDDEQEPFADENVEPLEGELEPEGEGPEFAIELEGEEQAEEPDLVKHLRGEIRERDKKLALIEKAKIPEIVVGERPKLEDFDWDDEKHAEAVEAWVERKHQAANRDQEAERIAAAQREESQKLFTAYQAKAAKLPVKDFDQAQETVIAALPELMQAAILKYAGDPAKVVYALAKYPAKLQALSQATDPIVFIKSIWEMERNIKVTTRRAPPPPEGETIQRGSASLSTTSDKQEAALEKEAERTGDRSKLIAYRARKGVK